MALTVDDGEPLAMFFTVAVQPFCSGKLSTTITKLPSETFTPPPVACSPGLQLTAAPLNWFSLTAGPVAVFTVTLVAPLRPLIPFVPLVPFAPLAPLVPLLPDCPLGPPSPAG